VLPILNEHMIFSKPSNAGVIWEPDFRCSSCKTIFPGAFCRESLERAEEELQELDKEATLENCPAFEVK